MKAIAKAHEDRSLSDFERMLQEHKKGSFRAVLARCRIKSSRAELSDDPIIRNHLAALYDTLLEQNLVRIIEPYSRVEIDRKSVV